MKNKSGKDQENSFITTATENRMSSFGVHAEGSEESDQGSEFSMDSGGGDGNFVNDKADRQAKKAARKEKRAAKKADKKAKKDAKKGGGAGGEEGGGDGDKVSPNQMYAKAKAGGYKKTFKEFMKEATDKGWIEKGIGIAGEWFDRLKGKKKEEGSGEPESSSSSGTSEADDKIFGVIPKPIFWTGVVIIGAVSTFLIVRAVTKKPETPAGGGTPVVGAAATT